MTMFAAAGLRRLLDDEPDMVLWRRQVTLPKVADGIRASSSRDYLMLIFECAADRTEWLILQESPHRVSFLTMQEGDEPQ
jgi:hypothetical protein